MISRQQANQIGSELIQQLEVQKRAEMNVKARRIPFLYRFPELQFFELWERPALLAQARAAAMKTPALIAVWVFFSTIAISVIIYSVKFEPLGNLPLVVYWVFTAILLCPAFLYRRTLMRRYIRAEALAS